jgi:hypothetical protein
MEHLSLACMRQRLFPESGRNVWNHNGSHAGEEALPRPEPSGQDVERHDAPCSVQLFLKWNLSYGFWVRRREVAGIAGVGGRARNECGDGRIRCEVSVREASARFAKLRPDTGCNPVRYYS